MFSVWFLPILKEKWVNVGLNIEQNKAEQLANIFRLFGCEAIAIPVGELPQTVIIHRILFPV